MDLNPRVIQDRMGNIPLPFFMTHPGYQGVHEDNTVLRDLEYLQQAYPNEAKRYQRKIADILDKFDYEGSMIYDEYPDRYSLQRLAGTVIQILKNENRKQSAEELISEEKWNWMEDMILVLLCHEIYKRRRGGSRGALHFY